MIEGGTIMDSPLSEDWEEFIRSRVQSGQYASEAALIEVARAGRATDTGKQRQSTGGGIARADGRTDGRQGNGLRWAAVALQLVRIQFRIDVELVMIGEAADRAAGRAANDVMASVASATRVAVGERAETVG